MVVAVESRALNLTEMTENGNYILSKLTTEGWTKNAICGLLGNMQSESTINPLRWQSDDIGNMSGGFGLVQWTPATKYFDWCSDQGINAKSMDSNLSRISWEVDNNQQWINSHDPKNRSFFEFTKSYDSAYDLAMAFIAAYERPADPTQPIRGTQAEYWFENLDGGQPVPPTSKGSLIDLMLCDALNGWK